MRQLGPGVEKGKFQGGDYILSHLAIILLFHPYFLEAGTD